MSRYLSLVEERFKEILEIARVLLDENDPGKASRSIVMDKQSTSVGRQGIDPLTGESKEIRGSQIGCKGEQEGALRSPPIGKTELPREAQQRATAQAFLDITGMIGLGIIRFHHDGRKPLPATEAKGMVAGHKHVALALRLQAILAAAHRQRLEIGVVLEKDAGILGPEGMSSIRRHGEAETSQPASAGFKVNDREHEVVDSAWREGSVQHRGNHFL
ncbi:hypothetical protein J2045_002234 [Peteryoungia aggregata LMG 23059]|uniref:Uncharacterized protein n=1 Tax=Peteryoungia aggregata LMG 23059 TaxID=1368425 RepID=A0ABU0G976_9HYPH|nr:hypothetical protein [Peteryoungia aggregata LMG 23059]